jgi:2-polyprenyl-3-methyl-5-hydroxy-6-metoxy-1,4-benzoquinol methylase
MVLEENLLIPFYNKHINYYSPFKDNPELILKILSEEELISKRVLDLGCGTGEVSNYISSVFGSDVTGVDYSDNRIENARDRYGNNSNFICANINLFLLNRYEFNKYDIILYLETLEHLKTDPEIILDKTYNLLTDDGVIVGSIPINVPFHFHIFNSVGEVKRSLMPDKSILINTYKKNDEMMLHLLCRWNNKP